MHFEHDDILTENKLILLYIINKIEIPVPSSHMVKFVTENTLMNYFVFQQLINELTSSGFIEKLDFEGKPSYNITQLGKETLAYFINRIPSALKNIVDVSIKSIRKDIKEDIGIICSFSPMADGGYEASCTIKEDGKSLISLTTLVGTRNDAISICKNWNNHAQNIYTEIIESILKSRE